MNFEYGYTVSKSFFDITDFHQFKSISDLVGSETGIFLTITQKTKIITYKILNITQVINKKIF